MELLAFLRTTGDLSSPLDLVLVFGAHLGLGCVWGGCGQACFVRGSVEKKRDKVSPDRGGWS